MGPRPHRLRRGPYERCAAWLVTGPLGHLWSALADLGSFFARVLAGRAADLLRRRPPGPSGDGR